DKYVKAFYFSPSNETGNKPVYMIIKEDITIEDETENVEKDFFIDSDKERLIDTIMPLIKK
ncbi:MAG: hypothetical protein U9P44_03620, partial [archaeon]|nr:hypothetical protein [archaeon]